MHIPDGVLSVPVLVAGGAIAATGCALAFRRMDDRAIVRTSILSAVFFAVSLVSIPVGPSSVHLVLSGLMGVMLGPAVVPAVCVGLALQALLFGFGGLTSLGVNTVNIALPGLLAGLLAGPVLRRAALTGRAAAIAGALAGASSIAGSGALVALSLWLSSSDYAPVARILLVTYLPLSVVEGAVTAAAVAFLARVEPAALSPRPAGAP